MAPRLRVRRDNQGAVQALRLIYVYHTMLAASASDESKHILEAIHYKEW